MDDIKLTLKQFGTLLWKCWIIRKRHPISTLFEIITPLFTVVLIAWIHYDRQDISDPGGPVKHDEQIFPLPQKVINLNSENCSFIQKIYYTPKNKFITDLINETNSCSENFFYEENQEVLLNRLLLESGTDGIGIIFNSESLQNHFDYTIRTDSRGLVGNTYYYFPNKRKTDPETYSLYFDTYFVQLQVLINEAYLKELNLNMSKTRKIEYTSIEIYRYPYPSYYSFENNFFTTPKRVSYFIVLSYAILCAIIIKRITDEKVAKTKEMLKMIGMSNFIYWLSHFINHFIIMIMQNIIITIFMCKGFGRKPVINYSSYFLFYVILTLFSAQSILFSMFVSTLMNTTVIAVMIIVILWIMLFAVPFSTLDNLDITKNLYRAISSIVPSNGLGWSMSNFDYYEQISKGMNWNDLYSSTSIYENFTIGVIMLIMLFSCFLYIILIWYIDAIWPWQYGVPKPYYFPFQISYWFPKVQKKKSDDYELNNIRNEEENNIEKEPDLPVKISIKNLRKEYGIRLKKLAVDNVSLNICYGQITVLLGHNGAGKTTTMNMITGIFPPTSGTVYINGYDIVTQTIKARTAMALCPQENIFYNELSVEQHLKFYSSIKRISNENLTKEVDIMLELLKLQDKKHELAISLSGGMKRRLMLGIALIGGTEILILDEPTSGLDPESRRAVWDMLQSIRTKSTILLTTHFMEEADVLGDRIAIMSEGKIKCCGSTMFLKKRYGAGYNLRIAKGNNYNSSIIDDIIRKYLPDSELKSEIHSEVVYALEKSETESNTKEFPDLFDDLEKNKELAGVDSYGIGVTTMEDVFLEVGKESETNGLNENGKKDDEKIILNNVDEETSYEKLCGFRLTLQRIIALLIKRIHYLKRYWPMMIFQTILPALLFILILEIDHLLKTSDIHKTGRNLTLNFQSMYGNTKGFFQDNSSEYSDFAQVYKEVGLKNGIEIEILPQSMDPNSWALQHAHDVDVYKQKYLVGLVITKVNETISLNPWFNMEALHALPLAINLLYKALAKYQSEINIEINTFNYPFSSSQLFNKNSDMVFLAWLNCCLILIPITVPFIGASYVLIPINEQSSKAKLLQIMTGMSSLTFWLTNFVFDLLIHIIAMSLIFIVLMIFDTEKTFFDQSDTMFGLMLMLFLFGFSSIPLAYCFSFWFNKPSSGFALLIIIYLFGGLILNACLSLLDLTLNVLKLDIFDKILFEFFTHICRFLPVFSMSYSIQRLYRTGSFVQLCKSLRSNPLFELGICFTEDFEKTMIGQGCCKNICIKNNSCYDGRNSLTFEYYGIAFDFIYMIIDGLLFLTIIWLLEGNMQKFWFRITKKKNNVENLTILKEDEDSDVVNERSRVTKLCETKTFTDQALLVINLTKTFKNKKAVDHINFGVYRKECFGLLGVNGAGKTTAFRMLTGDLRFDQGDALIDDISLSHNLHVFQTQIGYCPQFDALLDRLTGREMLFLFARLRGIPSYLIDSNVDNLIRMVDLHKHADKYIYTYSGGNKRKLSLAMALIGDPPLVFLDEPTSGVDSAAKRKIWSTLSNIQEKTSIILTSHSMEECEALCSRIVIMVNGEFKCLGPIQHLRNKFGQGYTIMIKIKPMYKDDPEYMSGMFRFIEQNLPASKLKDYYQCLIHYHIANKSVTWSQLFRVMENAKTQFDFEDYLVSDTTLEQIFISFARNQLLEN